MKQCIRVKSIVVVDLKGTKTILERKNKIKEIWKHIDLVPDMVGICRFDSYTIGLIDNDNPDNEIMARKIKTVHSIEELQKESSGLGEIIEVYNSMDNIDIWKI